MSDAHPAMSANREMKAWSISGYLMLLLFLAVVVVIFWRFIVVASGGGYDPLGIDLDRSPPVFVMATGVRILVLVLIAKGRSNKMIALELGVAEKTVKTHVGHILAKLDLTDRTQAALYAVRHGLV